MPTVKTSVSNVTVVNFLSNASIFDEVNINAFVAGNVSSFMDTFQNKIDHLGTIYMRDATQIVKLTTAQWNLDSDVVKHFDSSVKYTVGGAIGLATTDTMGSFSGKAIPASHANLISQGVYSLTNYGLDVAHTDSNGAYADHIKAAFTAANSSNYGSLTLAADGSYTYSINSVPVNYQDAKDTSVLQDWAFNSLNFGGDGTHTDIFTVNTVNGTSQQVYFDLDSNNYTDKLSMHAVAAQESGNLNFASGTHDVMVIAGNEVANGKLGYENFGYLNIDDSGAYTYNVNPFKLVNFGYANLSSFDDVFIISSTNSVHTSIKALDVHVETDAKVVFAESLSTDAYKAFKSMSGADGDTIFDFGKASAANYSKAIGVANNFDTITNWGSGDSIIYTSLLSTNDSTKASGTASINSSTGAATFDPADNTLLKQVAAVQNALTNDNAGGHAAHWQVGSDEYVLIEAAHAPTDNTSHAYDDLIKIVGGGGHVAIDHGYVHYA